MRLEFMADNNHYDIIIIGSGIGALTVAGIMARFNKKKVLILERHSKIGGYTHSFSRKTYKWDVGLHYIGTIFEGRLTGRVFDFITNGKLKWQKILEPFEAFVYPDFTFNQFGEEKKFKSDLIKMFPEEKRAIQSYFRDIKWATCWYLIYFLCRFMPAFFRIPLAIINKFFQGKALITTSDYLERRFTDRKLKSLLTSQWGNYGLPPSQSSFLIHALVVNHFINGGYYPRGGSEEIAKTIMPIIEQQGGKYLVNHEVTQLIVENNRAVGVLSNVNKKSKASTEKFYAPVIVSNIGAFNTYTKLMPKDVHVPFLKECEKINNTSTCVALYVGLKDGVRSLGIKSANHWIYDSYDHEKHYRNKNLIEGKPSACYLTFIFHKDLKAKASTAVIIAYVYYSKFEKWRHQLSGKRDKEYYALKDTISNGLINFVDHRYPGFSDMVDHAELATPLTSEHYTAHSEGAMYGLAATPERYRQKWLKVKTPLKGFYITGTDISALGVIPSMMGGLATSSYLNGPFGFFKLVRMMRRNNGHMTNS